MSLRHRIAKSTAATSRKATKIIGMNAAALGLLLGSWTAATSHSAQAARPVPAAIKVEAAPPPSAPQRVKPKATPDPFEGGCWDDAGCDMDAPTAFDDPKLPDTIVGLD